MLGTICTLDSQYADNCGASGIVTLMAMLLDRLDQASDTMCCFIGLFPSNGSIVALFVPVHEQSMVRIVLSMIIPCFRQGDTQIKKAVWDAEVGSLLRRLKVETECFIFNHDIVSVAE